MTLSTIPSDVDTLDGRCLPDLTFPSHKQYVLGDGPRPLRYPTKDVSGLGRHPVSLYPTYPLP